MLTFYTITPGLTGIPDTISFMSVTDDRYILDDYGQLKLQKDQKGMQFWKAATFIKRNNKFAKVSMDLFINTKN